MITLAHGDDAPAPTSHASVDLDVKIVDGGRGATLAVSQHADTELLADDQLVAAALGALASAGVVHGVNRAAVHEAVVARDGVARPVATATPPTPSVDGVIELFFADAAGRNPLYSVPAGALLARCTPARQGSDGVAVTGDPLPPAVAHTPALSAGAGAEESPEGSEGITVVHAIVDGRPTASGGRVAMDEVLRVNEMEARPDAIAIFGSLEAGAGLLDGAHVTLTGGLRVIGDIERAHIDSVGEVRIGGSCVASEIRSGTLSGLHRRLLDLLDEADTQVASVAAMAGQLVETAAASGRRLQESEALRMVLSTRYPELEGTLDEVRRSLGRAGAGIDAGIAEAIHAAAAAVESVTGGDRVPVARLAATGRALAEAMAGMRSAAGIASGIQAGYLQACRVETGGDLVLTGAGTYNVDAVIGGDLKAQSAGATVRGGTLQVGGRLLTTELGAPGGARVRVVLEGKGGRQRLAAGMVHPGVEVLCGGRSIVIATTTLNFTVGFDEDKRVVCTEDLLG